MACSMKSELRVVIIPVNPLKARWVCRLLGRALSNPSKDDYFQKPISIYEFNDLGYSPGIPSSAFIPVMLQLLEKRKGSFVCAALVIHPVKLTSSLTFSLYIQVEQCRDDASTNQISPFELMRRP